MHPLKVLTCDDEPLALDRLGTLLSQCAGVELLGAVLSGRELLDEVRRSEPTLVFLDIEMPQIDGFDVIEALSRMEWQAPHTPPLVVFVTAHPEFAANAFDSGALDFISKPIRLSRLEQALDRARQAAEQREARRRLAELSEQIEDLKRSRADAAESHHIWVRSAGAMIRIAVADVDWIGAEGEYIRYHAGADSYLERGSLTEAADRFGGFGFVRIHRSAVANRDRIVSIERTRWGNPVVQLHDGARLPVGKKYRAALQDLTRAGQAPA
jgi:two-component system, LytTR family, response regulator